MGTAPGEAEDISTVEVEETLECPLCGYDLRGLPGDPGDRCPECGHVYDLDAIRQAKREEGNWFYENASRSVRAFWWTSVKSLWPIGFWRDLKPTMPVVEGRMNRFAGRWVAFLLLSVAVLFCINAGEAWPYLGTYYPTNTARLAFQSLVRLVTAVERGTSAGALLRLLVLALLWPLIARSAIALFGVTLRRAGIRSGHLWRCVVYAMPLGVLGVLISGTCHVLIPGWNPISWPWRNWGIDWEFLNFLVEQVGQRLDCLDGLLILLLLTTIHLVAAHVRYLRLPMALAQAILVQIVTWLALFAGGYLVTLVVG